jgi:hypothetical protein
MSSRAAAVLLPLAAALAAAAPATAELVAPGVHEGALALGPGGVPRVAYVSGRELWLAARTAPGAWRRTRVALLPSETGSVVGLAVSPRGRPAILAEERSGGWLALAERAGNGWRLTPLVRRTPLGTTLGRAGLALDPRPLPHARRHAPGLPAEPAGPVCGAGRARKRRRPGRRGVRRPAGGGDRLDA